MLAAPAPRAPRPGPDGTSVPQPDCRCGRTTEPSAVGASAMIGWPNTGCRLKRRGGRAAVAPARCAGSARAPRCRSGLTLLIATLAGPELRWAPIALLPLVMAFCIVAGMRVGLGMRATRAARRSAGRARGRLRPRTPEVLSDGLTGLGNHRAFQEELDRQVARVRAEPGSIALLLVDLDDLKKTNEAQGHAAGDELLRATARIILGSLRRSGSRVPDRRGRVRGPAADCGPDEAAGIATAHPGGCAERRLRDARRRPVLADHRGVGDARAGERPQAARPPGGRRALLGEAPRPHRRPAVRSHPARHRGRWTVPVRADRRREPGRGRAGS